VNVCHESSFTIILCIPVGSQDLKSNPDGIGTVISLFYYTSLPHKREVNETAIRAL
jgi:hypothetical protein